MRLIAWILVVVGLSALSSACRSTRVPNPGEPRTPSWLEQIPRTNPHAVKTDEELLFGDQSEAADLEDGSPTPPEWCENPGPQRPDRRATELSGRAPELGKRLAPARTPARAAPKAKPSPPPATRGPGPSATGGSTVVYVAGPPAAAAQRTAPEPALPVAPAPTPEVASPLERYYRGEVRTRAEGKLEQFGYDFFDDADGASLKTTPVFPDYEIGAGDEIALRIWGTSTVDKTIQVDSEGRIALPMIGVHTIAGVRYADLGKRLRTLYSKELANFELDASLVKLRTIRVFIVGEIEKPGLHEVSARATVLTALAVAGGPKKTGSLRRIEWTGGTQKPVSLDLYRFLIHGDRSVDRQLKEGDTIRVPPVGATVGVRGYVGRPAIYETLTPLTVMQAIALAGGTTPFTYTQQVQLERTAAHGEREVREIEPQGTDAKLALRDGDVLHIGGIDRIIDNTVEIVGNVVRPGNYAWAPGMRVSDLLTMAGGFLIDTHFDTARLQRVRGETRTYEHVVERMKRHTSHQVIDVPLGRIVEDRLDPANVKLQVLDKLTILSTKDVWGWPKVSIIGAVKAPGTYELTAGMRVTDLLRLAGNVRADAYLSTAEVVRRIYDDQGSRFDVRRLRFSLRDALGKRRRDPLLKNHDEVIIRSAKEAQVRVTVSGEVRFPGEYVLPRGSRISDILAKCGGLTERGDLRAAKFTRESVRKMQQDRLEKLSREAIREFERAFEWITMIGRPNESQAAEIALEQDSNHMRTLQRLQANGRIVLQFCREDFPGSHDDLVLENGDSIEVPRELGTVSVVGEVFNPTTMVWRRGWKVEDYLDQIGGLTDHADRGLVFMVRADGTVISSPQIGFSRLLGLDVLPGDAVLIPEKATERPWSATVKDVAYLGFMLAFTSQQLSTPR